MDTYKILCTSYRKESKTLVDAIAKFIGDFTMISDIGCRVIDHAESKEMARLGKLPISKYWTVDKGCYGIIIDSYYYDRYSTTISKIHTAIGDFKSGWYACRGK